MVELNLNLADYQEELPSSPLPPGRYPVVVAMTTVKTTQNGDKMISVDYQVDTGDHRGRHVFENLNLWHKSTTVAEIAKRQLANIARACGITSVLRRTEDLHGKRLYIQVDVDRNYNVVKKHFGVTQVDALGGPARSTMPPVSAVPSNVGQAFAPAPAAPQPPAQAPTQAPTSDNVPW